MLFGPLSFVLSLFGAFQAPPGASFDTLAYLHLRYTYGVPRDPGLLELRGETWGLHLFSIFRPDEAIFNPVDEVMTVSRANERMRAEGVPFGLLYRVSCEGEEAVIVRVNLAAPGSLPNFYVCRIVASGKERTVLPKRVELWRG